MTMGARGIGGTIFISMHTSHPNFEDTLTEGRAGALSAMSSAMRSMPMAIFTSVASSHS